MIGISEFSRNQKLSFDRGELEGVLNELDYTPEKLVALFEKDFKWEFSSNSGVWEKYTIKQHTLMVLNQFEKYFKNTQLPSEINHDFFRVILVLHDLSKPEAIAWGGKQLKSEYAEKLMISTLSKLQYTEQEISIAAALVAADPIGQYLAKRISAKMSAEIIYMRAREAMLKIDALFSLFRIFYMVDAGSYTKDAGGLKGLDHIFIFDTKKKEMKFSPVYEKLMWDLDSYIKRLDNN